MTISTPNNRNKAVPLFEVEKKNFQKQNVLRRFETLLIVIVIIGTLFWFLLTNHFSFNNLVKNLAERLKPEVAVSSPTTELTDMQKLKKEIEETKVMDIASLSQTSENDFNVKDKNGLEVFFSKNKDFARSIRTLQTLLAKAKIDNKAIKKVDFRFDKIVVQY